MCVPLPGYALTLTKIQDQYVESPAGSQPGRGSDDIHIKLTVQSLLYDFHVEQSEESATETEAQSHV